MKAKMKKILAMICCVMLVLSTGACNSGTKAPSAPEKSYAESSSSAESGNAGTGDGKKWTGEVTTLNVFIEGGRPSNEKTDAVHQYLIDTIGVDIQITQVAENAKQQLSLMIADGEMPEMMRIDPDTYRDYAKQGAFLDITDDIQNYPNLMEYCSPTIETAKVDGRLYCVPSNSYLQTDYTIAVRKDWLDNLGLEIPTTLEDWKNVMHAFTFEDPDGNGVDDTYGFCCIGFSYMGAFFGAYGATDKHAYILEEDGTVTTNVISDNYRNALRCLHELYTDGVIDPEVFTAKSEDVHQKWSRGEFGLWQGWWSHPGNAYLRYDFENMQPDAEVQIIYPPVGEDGKSGLTYSNPFYSTIALSRDLSEEKKDAALRLLDYQVTKEGFYVVMYGLPGVDFELDENGDICWNWLVNDNKDRNGVETTDMELYKLVYHDGFQRPADRLGDSISAKMYGDATDMEKDCPTIADLFENTRTEEFFDYYTELEKYYQENSIRFIMGELDIEKDWDKYKSEYLSMGGEALRQSLLTEYNSVFGTDYTLND